MEVEQIREGVKYMQQGDKSASKGLFRNPDWDVAANYYDRAATAFKVAKSYDQAVQAYFKASESLFKSDAIHLAGKALESAAFILAQNLNQPQKAAEAYERASNLFMTQGTVDRAAEQLEKAGRALENVDFNASYDMYNKACLIYEQEDRARFADDVYKKTLSLLIRNKKYDKAIDILKRQSISLQTYTSRTHLYKANLSILILLFALGDEVEAGKQFRAMCGDDVGFSQSPEADIADNFMKAYEERDQELLEKTAREQHITFLDNEIAKLARTLVIPGESLSTTISNSENPAKSVFRPTYKDQEKPQETTYPNTVQGTDYSQSKPEPNSDSTTVTPSSNEKQGFSDDYKDDINRDFTNMKISKKSDDDEEDSGLR